jgi:hypothetical protein
MAADGRNTVTQMHHDGWRFPCEVKFPKFFGYTYAESDSGAGSICVICVHLRLTQTPAVIAAICGHLRFPPHAVGPATALTCPATTPHPSGRAHQMRV